MLPYASPLVGLSIFFTLIHSSLFTNTYFMSRTINHSFTMLHMGKIVGITNILTDICSTYTRHPIPSYSILSHPISSHPIPSHLIPPHTISYHPIPFHSIPSHPIVFLIFKHLN